MHSILTGSATIANVCIWAEKKLKGTIETCEGTKTFSGNADFLAGPPAGPQPTRDSKFIFFNFCLCILNVLM